MPRLGLLNPLVVLIILTVPMGCAGDGTQHHEQHARESEPHQEAEVVEAMALPHHHSDVHMKWTGERLPTAEDVRRAQVVVEALRSALEKYRDYRAAMADGFEPFLPDVSQPRYHFTRK